MATVALNATHLPHPFYPIEANIVGYLANQWSVSHTRDDTGISAEAQPHASFNGESDHTVVRIE